jgi:fructose-bisphosphate aldolase, class II
MRRAMNKDKREFDPRKLLKAAVAAATEVCEARFEAFGRAGQAERIRPVGLERMAERSARGERAPRAN